MEPLNGHATFVRPGRRHAQARYVLAMQQLPTRQRERKLSQIKCGSDIMDQHGILPDVRQCHDTCFTLLFITVFCGVLLSIGNLLQQKNIETTEIEGATDVQQIVDYGFLCGVATAAMFGSLMFGLLHNVLAHKTPKFIVWTSLISGPTLTIIFGLLMVSGVSGFDQIHLGDQVPILITASGICRLAYLFYYRRHLIPFQVTLAKAVAGFVRHRPGMMVIASVVAILRLVWIFILFWLSGKLGKYDKLGKFDRPLSELISILLMLWFFGVWWIITASNVCHVIYGGVFGRWYFNKQVAKALRISIAVAFTTSLGTICFGSLVAPFLCVGRGIVALVSAIRGLALWCENSSLKARVWSFIVVVVVVVVVVWLWYGSGGAAAAAFAAVIAVAAVGVGVVKCTDRITDYILRCVDTVFVNFQDLTYVHVAIRGRTFIESAKTTYALATCGNLDYILNDLFLNSLVIHGGMLHAVVGASCAAASCYAVAVVQHFTQIDFSHDISHAAVLMGSMVGLAAGSAYMGVINSGIKTLLVCGAEDMSLMETYHPEIHHELFYRLRGHYANEEAQADLELLQNFRHMMSKAAQSRRATKAIKAQFGKDSPEFTEGRAAQSVAEEAISSFVKQLAEKRQMKGEGDFLFVSGPEYDKDDAPALFLAVAVMQVLGYDNLAGDAQDQFHTEVMTKQEMELAVKGWRLAWKGKVCAGIDMRRRDLGNDMTEMVLVNIDGGKECQWEVEELKCRIMPSFAGTTLKSFSNWEDFLCFFLDLPTDFPMGLDP